MDELLCLGENVEVKMQDTEREDHTEEVQQDKEGQNQNKNSTTESGKRSYKEVLLSDRVQVNERTDKTVANWVQYYINGNRPKNIMLQKLSSLTAVVSRLSLIHI